MGSRAPFWTELAARAANLQGCSGAAVAGLITLDPPNDKKAEGFRHGEELRLTGDLA
jgi:hypothetical protein